MFFGSGYAPPGVCGDVIRHNQSADIDASPFFYGDVENMNELIDGAERLWHPSTTPTPVDSIVPNTESYQEEF